MHLTRKTLAALAAAVLASGCGSKSSISGKVTADGAPLANQAVVLQGGVKLLTATTGSDGTYSFSDVFEQTYLLSADVASTREEHEQAVVAVKGAVKVPDLAFNSVTDLSGTVIDAGGAPVANAQVLLLGTPLSAVTDAAGTFTFTGAPVGARTVSVTTDAGHAENQVMLARGHAATVSLQLAANPPGTVTGSVSFYSGTRADLITVTAEGSGVSTQAQQDGSYQLDLPAGTWTITASAPHYPAQTLGQVTVASGGVAKVAPAALTLFTDLPTFGIDSAFWQPASNVPVDYLGGSASVLVLRSPGAPPAFYRFDLQTHALTFLSVGAEPTLSPDGAWAAIPSNQSVLFEQVATHDTFGLPLTGSFSKVLFTRDGTRATVQTSGSPGKVYSVNLADGTNTSVDSYGTRQIGAEALLVQTTSATNNDWSLVGPAGITQAFTGVSGLDTDGDGANGIAVALEGCATAPCPLDVLGPTATHGVAIQGVTETTMPSLTWHGQTVLLDDGTQFTAVNVFDGSSTSLLTGAATPTMTFDGKHIAFTINSGHDLIVSPLPSSVPLVPVVSSTAPVTGGWLSNDRFVGYDDAPTSGAAYRFSIDSDVLSKDSDYTASSGAVVSTGSFGAAVWLGSDGVSRVLSGDNAVIVAPGGETANPSAVSIETTFQLADGLFNGGVGSHLAVSWDGTSTVLFGGASTQTYYGLQVDGPGLAGELAEVGDNSHRYLVDLASGQQLLVSEPDIFAPALSSTSYLSGSTINAVLVAPRSLGTSGPVGGAVAVLSALFF